MNFEWPIYKTERERIKAISQKYKNKSIVEAFSLEHNKVYNVDEMETPKDYVVGDTIKLTILSVDDNGNVEVDTRGLKNPIVVKGNFSTIIKRSFTTLPYNTEGRVLQIKHGVITVDILGHVAHMSLNEAIKNIGRQKNIKYSQGLPYTVRNLQLTRGGFLGDLVIDPFEVAGTIPAFIPGSHIVLNRAKDFNEFVGKSVQAYISSISPHGNVICSAKEVLQHEGNRNLIEIFKTWCDDGEDWKWYTEQYYDGIVTGTINKGDKKGVYVEIPVLNLTGFIAYDNPDEFEAWQPTRVKIAGIEEKTFYNKDVDQRQTMVPYVIEDDILKEINIKPILSF